MRAGRLRHIIAVRRPQSTLVRGSEVLTFVPYCNERAGIEPLRGNELLQSMQVNAELTTKIITRWSPQMEMVSASWIFAYKNPVTQEDVIYEVSAPPIHSQLGQRELIFMCKSGKNKPATHSGVIK